jgi:hypothetical protein
MDEAKSVAHRHDMNHFGLAQNPDGLVPWRPAEAPNVDGGGRTAGMLRGCGYCGSMHPADVAAAIRAGAKGHWADFKYGWPHKAYFDGVPNPHAGMREIRSSANFKPEGEGWEPRHEARYDERTGERLADRETWVKYSMATETTHGKFYTVHLQDASAEDRATIEQHLGLKFEFTDDGSVRWQPSKA